MAVKQEGSNCMALTAPTMTPRLARTRSSPCGSAGSPPTRRCSDWATMRFFAGPSVLIICELGDLPHAHDAAAALFHPVGPDVHR